MDLCNVFMKDLKKFTSMAIASLLCLTMAAGLLTGCGRQEEEEVTYALTAVTEDDLQPGNFYVRTSEGFYQLPSGTVNYSERELIAKEADPSRVVWYGADDVLIPTMYSDDQLVYCTTESIPASFTWERYEDDGYTIGVSGLAANDAGRYGTTVSETSLKLDSSFAAGLPELNEGDILIVDKIDGNTVNNTNVAPGGTVSGLSSGHTYSVDTYIGSTYTAIDCVADTHAFSSFEVYETSNYSFAQSDYIILTVPNYLRSGYYYMNGVGMVRYANVTREEGIAGINFNAPYYLGTDEEGNIITADDQTTETTEETPTESNVYTSNFYIDCTNEQMLVKVSYSDILTEINGVEINATDAVLESLNANPPTVTMVGPDGEDYVFTPSNQEENTLECTVDMPLSGEWTVTLTGFDLRTFTVTNELTSGHSDTIMHTGSGRADMTYYLKDSADSCIFEISWENVDRAANVVIETPDGEKISKETNEDAIVDEGYGYIRLRVPNAVYGNYNIQIEGDELGRVRVTTESEDVSDEVEVVPVEEAVEGEASEGEATVSE